MVLNPHSQSSSFAHLHVHTHYSLLKSSCTVSGLVNKCIEMGQPGLAITDYGNMFGVLDLYFSAKEKGLKPLLGLEISLSSKTTKKNISRGEMQTHNDSIVLLAENIKGYRHLCRINTIAYQEEFYYVPQVDFSILSEYSDFVVALTGGLQGKVARTYMQKGAEEALKLIRQLKDIYSDRLYLELNRTGPKEWEQLNPFLIEASRITGVPVTATNDVHFLEKKDRLVQDVLLCIGSNRTLRDPERFQLKSEEFYFKNSEQMRELFQDIPSACDSTLEICSRCHVNFHLKKDDRAIYHLPSLQLQKEGDSKEQLRRLSLVGLKKRLSLEEEHKKQDPQKREEKRKKYEKRLEMELRIIIDMGFTDYFLIVYDFVHWARKQGIPVGPGRGSGASSLVAYCLEITNLDPMPYKLLFERFLNPERISLPDFDIDFCQENRNRVIDYVSEKYGKNYVAQVMTYGRLQARAAIRDVGRVLGMSYMEVDQVAKLIPERLGITLDEAISDNPRLYELMESDPQIKNLMDLARQIEGLIRHVSIHAAGVIIANHPIVTYAPLYRGSEGENVIQCDLYHSKKIGLVKFDFLGLKTLTQLKSAFQMIEKNKNKKLSEKDISLKDSGIYRLMCEGKTTGIFQFDGRGITELIVKAQPTCFEDIVAINALFRPGPMDMIPSYLDRKKGQVKVDYLFPELEPILKETYGVIVYQEQVLLIAAKIAGYRYGEADILRRAMSEKKTNVMKKQKSRFLSGASANKYDLKKSERLFDLVAEFAKYGFNKSHAAAYCVLAAQTAWLKCYYPVEFFASLLTVEISNTSKSRAQKMVRYVRDARRQGVKVLPPHINHSEYSFIPAGNHIYFSLGAIKGMGRPAVNEIISVRNSLKNKKFESVQHFFETVDMKKISKKCVESLVRAGTFSEMDLNGKEILHNYESLLRQVNQKKEEFSSGQINLFSMIKEAKPFVYQKQDNWSPLVGLEYEKGVIGFYLSGHPIDRFIPFRSVLSCKSIRSLETKKHRSTVSVWGIVDDFRQIITRKGMPMAFARLEDGSSSIEIIIFSDVYLRVEERVRSKKPLRVKGTLSLEDKSSAKLIVQEVDFIDDQLRARGVNPQRKEKESVLPNPM